MEESLNGVSKIMPKVILSNCLEFYHYHIAQKITDCKEEKLVLQNRIQEIRQDMMNKRMRIDGLSNQMATLAGQQKAISAKQQELETSLRTANQVFMALKSTR